MIDILRGQFKQCQLKQVIMMTQNSWKQLPTASPHNSFSSEDESNRQAQLIHNAKGNHVD